METISRHELLALKGTQDATHAVFHEDGELYFSVSAKRLDEETEEQFWQDRGKTMKKVINGEGI